MALPLCRLELARVSGLLLLLGPLISGAHSTPVQAQETGASLTLPQAVKMALDYHPAVGQAQARIDAASGVVTQARSALFPSVMTEGSLARFQEPMVVAPLHGFDPTMPPTFDRNLLQGKLSMGFTVYDGGSRGGRIHRAEAGKAMAEVGGGGTRMEVTAQVSTAYLSVLSYRELLDAAGSQVAALEAEMARVEQFLAEGKAARVDLLRVQAALGRARATEISAASDLAVAEGRLARLTGLPVGAVSNMDLARVRIPDDETPSADEAVRSAMASNPEVEVARQEVAMAQAEARVAAAAWLPTLRAGGGYSDFGTLDGGHTQEWQASLQLSYPLFTGGARRGERERALAELKRAEEGARLAELTVRNDVEEALAKVSETRATRDALELATAQAEEVARIEALALEAGAGVQTDFLRSQADLFASRAALTQARHGEVLARIRLAQAMGELNLGWIAENTEVER